MIVPTRRRANPSGPDSPCPDRKRCSISRVAKGLLLILATTTKGKDLKQNKQGWYSIVKMGSIGYKGHFKSLSSTFQRV